MLESHDRLAVTAVSEVLDAAALVDRPRRRRRRSSATTTSIPTDVRAVRGRASASSPARATSGAARADGRRRRRELVYEHGRDRRADARRRGARARPRRLPGLRARADRRLPLTRASRPATSAATSTTRRSSATTRASHAWVDVWDDERGWVSLDPTHDREQTEAYVRVAVGRDYADVPPTRGVYKGTASETLSVRVGLQAL